jgi:tetratricopeptide (TPR) repeat protein
MRTSLLAAAALLLALSRPAAAAPRLSPAAEAQLDEGLRRLYSLDYAQSRAAFRKLIELEPDNPFGYLFEAGGIWWESSQEYGLFKDTPTLQGLFEHDVEAAQRKADAYIDSKDPQTRADGYFVSGMALGTLGQWRLMKGHWMDAYFAGKKAIKHLKKCVKMDPSYDDAYLGLGVFDYQAAHLSGVAKLGVLLGMRGDEKRGIAEIQLAMGKSRYSRRQAAEFLLSIYLIDTHDFARALPVAQTLRAEVPGSPYYVFLEALLRHRLGDWDGSLAVGRELYAQLEADPAAFRAKWLTLVCGLSGADCLAKEDAERAVRWFDHAIEATSKEKPSGFQALVRLFRGQLLDSLGRRDEAVADYSKALALPEMDFTRRRAAECLAAPCGRLEVLGRLRALSQGGGAESSTGNVNVTPLR